MHMYSSCELVALEQLIGADDLVVLNQWIDSFVRSE